MTDDICGAECADGTPCEHPAGSCPVPSHSDPEASNPQGRPTAISVDDHDAILEAARKGKSKAGCSRAVGATRDSLRRYLDSNPEFRADFRRARAEGEDRLIEGGLMDENVDSSMAKFLLSSSFDYTKTEEVEHSGDGIVIHTTSNGSDE